MHRDEETYEEWEQHGMFPTSQPTDIEEWHALVREYEAGVAEVMTWATAPERLAQESEPGVTMADNLMSLAVHSAHHFGKIVALRQQMGVW